MAAYFIANDRLRLQRQLDFNEKGELTYPKTDEKVYLQPPVLAGVSFVIVRAKGTAAGQPLAMLPRVGLLRLMFVVLLERLAAMLKQDWEATEIYYGGLGSGGGQCHVDGRAIDFYGARTSYGQFMVERDWWMAPIRLPDGSEVSGNDHKGNWGSGTMWPAGVPPTYRLATGSNPLARAFFTDVLDFANQQGRSGVFVCHPDHPNPKLRKDHWNHVHLQIGTT